MHFTRLTLLIRHLTRFGLALLVLMAFGTPVVHAQPCPPLNGHGGFPGGAGAMPLTDLLGCGGLWLGNSGMQCHGNPQAAACPTIRVRSLRIANDLQLDADVPPAAGGGTPKLKECQSPASGKYPDCKCPDQSRYDPATGACKAGAATAQAVVGAGSAASARQDQARMNMIMGILLLNEHHKLGLEINANPSMAKKK